MPLGAGPGRGAPGSPLARCPAPSVPVGGRSGGPKGREGCPVRVLPVREGAAKRGPLWMGLGRLAEGQRVVPFPRAYPVPRRPAAPG